MDCLNHGLKEIQLIISEQINLALSTQVLLEYDDVLKREEILELTDLNTEQIEDILELLALLAQKHNKYYRLRPNLMDENEIFLLSVHLPVIVIILLLQIYETLIVES